MIQKYQQLLDKHFLIFKIVYISNLNYYFGKTQKIENYFVVEHTILNLNT